MDYITVYNYKKRQKIQTISNPELHQLFVKALQNSGPSPNKIRALMGVKNISTSDISAYLTHYMESQDIPSYHDQNTPSNGPFEIRLTVDTPKRRSNHFNPKKRKVITEYIESGDVKRPKRSVY